MSHTVLTTRLRGTDPQFPRELSRSLSWIRRTPILVGLTPSCVLQMSSSGGMNAIIGLFSSVDVRSDYSIYCNASNHIQDYIETEAADVVTKICFILKAVVNTPGM